LLRLEHPLLLLMLFLLLLLLPEPGRPIAIYLLLLLLDLLSRLGKVMMMVWPFGRGDQPR